MNIQMQKKPELLLRKGQVIKGKWHHHSYRIIRKLGSGQIGSVYLCSTSNQLAALKISKQNTSISSEVNVLRDFGRVQGYHLGPSLLDVDDYITPGGLTYSFYVMEYIKGQGLYEYTKQHGEEALIPLFIGFSNDLAVLHKQGYVFGDLKIENLIVSDSSRLKWVDVGGTTKQGRAIKEYTNFYDRAYWQCGSRKAEPSYDLFALAMVILRVYYPHGFPKEKQPTRVLMKKINQAAMDPSMKKLLVRLINGSITEARQVKEFLLTYCMKLQAKNQVDRQKKQENTIYPFLEIGSILTIGGIGYLYVTLFM